MQGDVIVIGCGAKKKPVPYAKAVDLYIGNMFKQNLRLAKAAGGPHYILSGHYGLIPVTKVIANYSSTIKDAPREVVEKWSDMVYSQFKAISQPGRLIVVCGKDYLGTWYDRLVAEGWNIVTPLIGLKLGFRMSKINSVLDKLGGGP